MQINRREEIFRADWQANNAWRVYGRYFYNTNNAGAGVGPYGSFVLNSNLPLTNVSDIRPVYNVSVAHRRHQPDAVLRGTFGTGHNSIFIHDADGTWTRSGLGVTGSAAALPERGEGRLPAAVPARRTLRHLAEHRLEQRAVHQLQHDLRLPRQPDQGLGPAHVEGRALRAEEPEGPERFGENNGVINFSDDTSNPFDTTLRGRQRRDRRVQQFRQASVYSIGEYRYWNVEWYAQDNWKISDRLTLDYGLRFYWVQPQHDEAGLTSNFNPELFQPEPGGAAVSAGLNAAASAWRRPGHRPAAVPRSTSAASCRRAAA